jgi:hypothetical protein
LELPGVMGSRVAGVWKPVRKERKRTAKGAVSPASGLVREWRGRAAAPAGSALGGGRCSFDPRPALRAPGWRVGRGRQALNSNRGLEARASQ